MGNAMAKLPVRKPDKGGLGRRSYIAPRVLTLSRQKATEACAAPEEGQQLLPRDQSRAGDDKSRGYHVKAAALMTTAGVRCRAV